MRTSKKLSNLHLVTAKQTESSFDYTKAEALEHASRNLKNALVLPSIMFTYKDWCTNKQLFVKRILHFETTNNLIVRSSCQREDTQLNSMAGYFDSVLNISHKADDIHAAIEHVFCSYGEPIEDDQVFIQPMLNNVKLSGVMFTYEPNTGAPYYVLNYDDETKSTESITSGTSKNSKTEFISYLTVQTDGWHKNLIETSDELKQLFTLEALDIEFALDKNDNLYIFQVRPLSLQSDFSHQSAKHKIELNCIAKKIYRLSRPHPYLLGQTTIFGVMPDWNPAEIIGIRPKPLALSLYKELITDRIWSHQRADYGYRNVNGFPLLVVLGGTPFIDTRLSFNSFVPANLDDLLAEKLVNYYLEKLSLNPSLHDKIEFDIVHSCYSFDIDNRMDDMHESGFTHEETAQIKQSLLHLTNEIICDDGRCWVNDIAKIETLKSKQLVVKNSHLNKIEKIYWLIEDCKNFGTLPFAGLARVGFIAMQLLESLITINAITREDANLFLSSIDTVGSQLQTEFNHLDKDVFLQKYGHLRPGTYDILSARYDEKPEQYFNWEERSNSSKCKPNSFPISLDKLNTINNILREHNLKIEAIGLFNFIKSAIEAREFGKFVFTKSLSDCLVLIEQLGSGLGVCKNDMAYVDIGDLLKLYSNSYSANNTLQSSISLGKENYQIAKGIRLPSIIQNKEQIYHFKLMQEQPNFVTENAVTGRVISVSNHDKVNLQGALLFIESADPGYDWIFSQKIAGFVTKYGGCNSHMAIRAGELNLPAVIGAGELHYRQWSQAIKLHIDCANKKVEILQ
jgi:phosphohistidine swiveling domain-containing protein